MTRLSDHELHTYIREDLPYFDLTTHLLDVPLQEATLSIVTRQKVIAACTEEAARTGELLDCNLSPDSIFRAFITKTGIGIIPRDFHMGITKINHDEDTLSIDTDYDKDSGLDIYVSRHGRPPSKVLVDGEECPVELFHSLVDS